MIPLLWGVNSSQNHRDRKSNTDFQGLGGGGKMGNYYYVLWAVMCIEL